MMAMMSFMSPPRWRLSRERGSKCRANGKNPTIPGILAQSNITWR